MDKYGKLQLKWSLGYKGSQLHFVNNSTLVFGCGNALTFIRSDGTHIRSLPSEGRGVGTIAVCPKIGLIAYTESTLNPQIFMLKYPDGSLINTLKGKAQLEYTCLAFTSDGKKLATLSGVPDFLLTIWDCPEGSEMCEVSVGPGATQLSFNPLNWRQLCLMGPGRVTLWTLEQCDTQNLLSPINYVLQGRAPPYYTTSQDSVTTFSSPDPPDPQQYPHEVEVPDKNTPVGTLVQLLRPPSALPSKSSILDNMGQKLERTETKSDHLLVAALTSPPDLSHILYKESYDTFMKKKDPVIFTAHCWTPHQSIYVACEGGQLLLADSETGAIKVVANPQIAQLDNLESSGDRSGGGEEQEAPQTGHAMLGEGLVNCLALNKRGIFTAGKNGVVCCFEQTAELPLVESCTLPHPITCLAWSTNYDKFAFGTQQGAIFLADPLKLSSGAILVSDHHLSPIVGIDVLTPGFNHCVSCRSDGIVQVWNIEDASHVSSFNLGTECCSVACPLSSHVAMVGTTSGYLCVISLTNLASPRMVTERRMYYSPVKAIRHDCSGRIMATISSEGPAFFYDARPSSHFAVLGYTATEGEVLDLSLLSLEEDRTQVAVLAIHKGKRVVLLLQLPNFIVEEAPPELYTDATKQFASSFISKQEVVVTEPVTTFTLAPNNCAFGISDSTLTLTKFRLPQANEKDVLSPEASFPGHELSGGVVILSFHRKWMASAAPDGKLLTRLVESPEKTVAFVPHHYQRGGCSSVVFSTDSQYLITAGDGGTLTCCNWQLTDFGNARSSAAMEYAQRYMRSLQGLHSKENATLDIMHAVEADEDNSEKTWLDLAKEEARKAEDEKYAEIKVQLRKEISELREKVLSMIAENEQLPDIEQLERHNFILDTEEHQRLQAEEDHLIQQVQEELELANLAKMFLLEQIKKECWRGMAVKGKVVKSFQSCLEVSNYPLKARSEAKLKELERVKTLRKIEIAEKEVSKEVDTALKQTSQSYRAEDEEDLLGEEKEQTSQEEGPGDPDALRGSRGAQYGGECELLYSQFELHSPIAKKHQMELLQDCVYRIKESFNKEFEEVLRLKKVEIARIQEKNVRISKIISQLKLDEAIVQPSLSTSEEPERLLVVEDSEITVEKYISPEEKRKMEEAEKQEEQRRLAEMGDNPRERALDMMMGGRLEANVEEDLFKDFVRPDFMQKDISEMTEEELRQASEIEKKEQAFLEEREKLKRALEAELRKLQGSIVQAMEHFDERLNKLFHLKIKTEMAVHQEELQVLNLACSLLMEEELDRKERQLHSLLEEKKTAKVQLGSVLNMAKRKVDEQKEQYEQMAADDRELDKSFRRDFADCDPYVDQLYKLFRKRPRGQKLKLGPSEGALVPDPTSQNPFAQRPSSAVGGGRGEDPMVELDHVSHMPEGIDTSTWERFVAARRKKVESEQKVKAMALKLAEMNAFLQKRQTEDEHLQQEIQDAFKELNNLHEDKSVADLNLEIQFLLRQGQVEVDLGNFVPDFSNSVLVHRSAIEELNAQIKTLGEAKLGSMTECMDFKKGIHVLVWELKKLHMEVEDLAEKVRDVQMLRVTKEFQQRLMEENIAGKDQHEIETLEKTIELNQKMHQNNMKRRQRGLTKLQQQVEEKKEENRRLDSQLVEQQVVVLERQAVEKLAGTLPSESNREQRMQDIVTRRRLVELVKSQAQEISVLQSEVEKLRMRTFPALVQVD